MDEYQGVRLYVSLAGLALVSIFAVADAWQGGSPIPNLVVLALIAGHSAWCRWRGVRAPRTVLAFDLTLLGGLLLTIPGYPSVMTGTVGFLALVVVLFTEGRWRVGFLTYLAGWYAVAFLIGPGVTPDSIGDLAGSSLSLAAAVAVMIRVVGWLGRLDANRSQMLGTVSHELRNNLTGVLGLTEAVATTEDLEPAEARELICLANQQAMDATEIVEDLLTTSRVERSAMTMNTALVDVNAEVVATARRFQGTGTDIGLVLSDDLPSGWADSLRVRQAIRNLLSNAIRYGGPTVTVATRHNGDTIEITVSDNGDGVPPDDEATIFLPYRHSTAGRRDESSIGLGLWICRHLAQGMGGNLEYQRRCDFTEFVLTVPAVLPGQDPASASASSRAAVRSPRRRGPSQPDALFTGHELLTLGAYG
jgi:signal transduction histidine kinase